MPGTRGSPPAREPAGPCPRGQLGVVLVDSTPLFRDALCALVRQTTGLCWLGATPRARAALVMQERLHPDIALIDSVLDPHGRLCKVLTSNDPGLTVVSLIRDPCRTARFVRETSAAGAHGILLRSVEPVALVGAIRRAHHERHFIDPALSALTTTSQVASHPELRQPLSRREYQVLELIADGMDNQSIGKGMYVSVETVRTHVKSILRKFHARDRAHAVALAYRLGVLTTTVEPSQPAAQNGTAQRARNHEEFPPPHLTTRPCPHY